MDKQSAMTNVRNILALESQRGSISANERAAFDAVLSGDDSAADELKDYYTGPKAKTTLTQHDSRTFLESLDVILDGEKKSAKKAATKKA